MPEFVRLPAVGYQASGALFNPWVVYPVVHRFDGSTSEEIAPQLTEPSSVYLRDQGLCLYFGHHHIVFAPDPSVHDAHRLIEPLRLYFMYRTFINYNLEYPILELPDTDLHPATDAIDFSLSHLVTVETPSSEPPGSVSSYHTTRQEQLTIGMRDLLQFLRIIDRSLFYSIAFYLRGQDPVYFLVEYSKSVEVIFKALGGKTAALNTLASVGVSKAESKRFHKICNDDRDSPLDIGRHAPQPGVSLRSIDPKRWEGSQREILQQSASFCRSVIDGYAQWKVNQYPQSRLTSA